MTCVRVCAQAGKGGRRSVRWRPWSASARRTAPALASCTTRSSPRRRRGFGNKPGVHLTHRLGFLALVFDSRLVLRFKKYRHGLRTSNVPTYQQLQFQWQTEIVGMPPAATKVVAGYLLNRLQDDFARMSITCSIGPDLVWVIEIPDAPAAATPTPMPEPPNAGEPTRPVVRPTRTEEQQAADAE